MQITPLGDTALTLTIGDKIDEPTHRRVQTVLHQLESEPLPGVWELVPAYTTVTLFYDPLRVIEAGAPANDIAGWLGERVKERLTKSPKAKADTGARLVEIPVCYGGEFGPDLATVAEHTKLSPEEVIKRHAGGNYLVYLVGFSPGFAYLGGLPSELATPRRVTPRPRVPSGSVGIGGEQTGVYPVSTPGGWNLIGRTPLRLFLPDQNPPVVIRAGDRVKFRAISAEEFVALEEKR